MCGIAGIISLRDTASLKHVVKRMTDSISHRGPDGEGVWENDARNVCLGHRRLSILDLTEAGAQPMHYANRYTIVFNGEIYNYLELRKKLIANGFEFKSDSDTEVLLALYHEKQEKCLLDLDGMFAFVIFDSKENTIFAARDRFGEKPFYYTINDGLLYFSSEIKAFWEIGLNKNADAEMLYYYLRDAQLHHPFDNSKTFYKDIIKLKPASYLKINLSNSKLPEQTKYWTIDENRSNIYDSWNQNDIVDKFYDLFKESIQRRLRSDVPVGSSLSGGLDSSAVVCMINEIKKNTNIKQATFSARFPGFAKDEGAFMNSVISATNTTAHFTFPEKNGFLESFDKMCFHQDEPFGSASIYAQYEVMRLAKDAGVTVLLDGQGADEMLGGYSYYRDSLNVKLFDNLNVVNPLSSSSVSTMQLLKSSVKRNIPAVLNLYRKFKRINSGTILNSPYQKDFMNSVSALKSAYPVHTSLYGHLRHDLLDGNLEDLLRYADRNSMAHSREVRLPFLSSELVEFVMALPDIYKINGEWTKWVQRLAFEKIMPQEITWRKDKVGYEPPQKTWMEDANIKERIMSSKKTLFDNGIITKFEANRVPDSAAANSRGDNSWSYLMSSILFTK
jgi:asparagine synthase (glutamine-hydrolysing)